MKINEICTTGFFQLFLQNMKKMQFLHMCEWKKVQQNEKINGILLQKKIFKWYFHKRVQEIK